MERERRKRPKQEAKASAFEKFRQVKTGGSKHKYEIGEVDNVYEEISEKEYTERVLQRQDDDWIVSDGVGNDYVEDGREIFDDDLDEQSIQKDQKSKKRVRSGAHKVVEGPKGNIQHMIANMPARKEKQIKLDEDEILESMIKELGDDVGHPRKANSNIRNEKKETEDYLKSFASAPIIKPPVKTYSRALPKKQATNEIIVSKPELVPSIPVVSESKLERLKPSIADDLLEEMDIDEFDSPFDENMAQVVDDVAQMPNTAAPAALKTEITIPDEFFGDWDTKGTENEAHNVNINCDASQLPLCEGENGKKVFKFFHWDAYEDVFNQPGTVFLFGKVKTESSNSYVSTCVTVKNIFRRVYLLPREKNRTTDEVIKMIDVYNEFNSKIADKYRINKFKSRKVTKSYAFNIPGIPDTSDYLEVLFDASYGALPTDLQGDTFSHAFGTNTGFLEQFLIERKIKGAGWLTVQNAVPSSKRASWCKFDVDCNDMYDISVCKDGGPPPPLVVMALNIRVSPIPKSHENQITMIGCLVQNEFHTGRAAPKPHFQQHFCAFTKPPDATWPYNSKDAFAKFNQIKLFQKFSERELLEFFLAKYFRVDPDLIVGHDILGFDIGTLIHRLVVNKVNEPSRLGRLHRKNIANTGKNRQFIERNILCGRLLCDIKITAKELMRSRSYDLDSLCEQVLHMKEGDRKEVKAEEIKAMYSTSQSVIDLVKLTMLDARCILRIMYDLNIIPLSLQITNIAGNVLSRTLMGGRSERNEFLLLHAFSDRDYIVPDKVYAKKPAKGSAADEGQEAGGAKGKRKPAYEGGLVLEPKKGFYDKLILLMDFNSLYPSIIQEYNICFSTISVRALNIQNEADLVVMLDNLPSNNDPGILPTEIKKLVDSRREVKKLMGQQDISEDLRHQYNIRQMALKLTANSMYGCLGFPNSRFYAKPLAAMVTAKGREILMNTRDLVQKLNYDVIYGDTDSIMINTNSVNYDDVFNIGRKIKFEVNKLYRRIELDIDGVFKYMLLLKKKKYAAVTISKVNGKLITKEEIKGLDMVRRDWSQLSAEAGKFVLSQILSDQNIEDKIANIHARLSKLKIDLDENKVPLALLAITKQLTKNPEDYPDKKALSHVQVAIRMNTKMAKKFRQGDTIAYVVCEDGTTNAATQRGYHVDELKSRDDLKIDIKYYLSQQIHPVVTRLCEPIDGIDAIQIAESLGLDATAYKHIHRMDNVNEEDDICVDDLNRYRNCDNFEFKCMNPQCGITNIMEGPVVKSDSGMYTFVLDRCVNVKCHEKPFNYVSQLQNMLWLKIRFYIHKYYSRWMVCEDLTCAYRTRDIRSYNKNYEVQCTQCRRNPLMREYTESQLFNQLCFFQYMFDITNAISKDKTLKKDKDDPSFQAYVKLKELVDTVLKVNAYNIIDLGKICELLMMK